jgi:choline dehydrogenase-like flavoprotein
LAATSLQVCLVEGGGLEYEAESQALYAGENAGSAVGFEIGRLRFLGGSTNHWGGRCAPLDDIDFRHREWIPHSGWPIARAELDPYYVRARQVAGFPGPWLADAQTLGDTLNIRLPAVNADWLRPFLWHYSPVMQDGAVWNWGVAYRQLLSDSRNIRTLLHANFAGFATNDARDEVRGLTVKSLGGGAATVVAKNYVLCCGGIENARLLLLAAEQNGGGFGSRHDRVGRYFMQHSRGPSGLVLSPELMTRTQEQFNILRGADGISIEVGLTLAPAEQERQGLLNCSAVLQYLGDPDSGVTAAQDIWRALKTGEWAADMGEKVAHVAGDLGAFAHSLAHRVSSGRSLALEGAAGLPARSASIVLDIEQAPDPDSRILLGAQRDALGLRCVKADWRIGELERRTAAAFTRRIGAEFARLGIGRCRLEPWVEDDRLPIADALKETYHYIGTTRMSDDPGAGVTDRNCAVHGMRNLFVAGSSVFPTAGQANPTLTIVALALRLADHLR